MMTVHQILKRKGQDVWGIDPEAAVLEALRIMADKNVGALLVMRDRKLLGIFSERDYARKMVLKGKHSADTPVRDVMSSNPICVSPDKSVEQCMSLMTDNHIRHLPVTDGGNVLGIISIGDVVKNIIIEQQGTISHLENYITGNR
jgi:CBS domain-containing protein